MKSLKSLKTKKILIIIFLVIASSIFNFDANATTYVVAINNKKSIVGSSLDFDRILFMLEKGDRLFWYNLGGEENYKLISLIEVPTGEGVPNKRTLIRKNNDKILAIKDSLSNSSDTNSEYILLPQFLSEISTHVRKKDEETHFLIIGNVLYNDAREPSFSMLNGFYPSDGHLNSPSDKTPFSTVGKQDYLKNSFINFIYNDNWSSDLHQNHVQRFWSLFIQSQGGKLTSFTPDIETGLERFISRRNESIKEYSLDTSDRDVSMIQINRGIINNSEKNSEISGVEWLNDNTVITNQAPTELTGDLQIGIKWKCKTCDFDLYAKSKYEESFLFFGNKESNDGYFNKDYLDSLNNANSLEYVVIKKSVNVNDLNIKINLYNGNPNGENSGEVRAYFNKKVYSMPFTINAQQGNQGKNAKNAENDKHWLIINHKQLFNLK